MNERSVEMVPLYSFVGVGLRTIGVNLFTLAVGMTLSPCKYVYISGRVKPTVNINTLQRLFMLAVI